MNERQPIYLTAEGVENLRQELEHLISVKRPALAKRLHNAIQQGDLSENADYQVAKEEQGFLEGRIQQIEVMLREAVIIQEDVSTDVVALGCRVTVVEEGQEDSETFLIVGAAEADPTAGKVSNESPMGRALLGHRAGDTVTVQAPRDDIVFYITALE